MYRLLALFVVMLGACFSGLTAKERLVQAVREYNDGVRWGKYEQSVVHLPVESRRRFADRHAAIDDELEVADYDVQRIDVDSAKDTAEVRVDISWSLKRRGIVERTLVAQSWEQKGGEWVMLKEERVKGAPLALFDERPRAAAEAAKGSVQ